MMPKRRAERVTIVNADETGERRIDIDEIVLGTDRNCERPRGMLHVAPQRCLDRDLGSARLARPASRGHSAYFLRFVLTGFSRNVGTPVMIPS